VKNKNLEVQSLMRALDILEIVGNSARAVSLKVITDKVGLPKSTVYRLLSNLESRDYVRCNCDGTYQLGLQLLTVSLQFEQNFELKQTARPYLVSLNEATQESVHLGILQGGKVIYIDTIESPQLVRLVAKIGAANSVHCTSLGKALMISRDDEEIAKLLRLQGMEKRTEFTIRDIGSFLEEMALVRKMGFAFDERESAPDCRCVGAPIFGPKGDAIAAISVSGPASRYTPETAREVGSKLVSIAQEISDKLSHKVGPRES
jgi:DNA-binding IclR family transcriptional regulator